MLNKLPPELLCDILKNIDNLFLIATVSQHWLTTASLYKKQFLKILESQCFNSDNIYIPTQSYWKQFHNAFGPFNETILSKIFKHCQIKNDFKLLKWLCSTYDLNKTPIVILKHIGLVFLTDTSQLKWLSTRIKIYDAPFYDVISGYFSQCYWGGWPIEAKYGLKMFPDFKNVQPLFKMCCDVGNLKVAKYIYAHYHAYLDKNSFNDITLYASHSKNYHIFKWLTNKMLKDEYFENQHDFLKLSLLHLNDK